jgi:AcrR family transcriptional regulator
LSDDIRQAALTLFLERGYEGTSLDDIARAARTTKPSLYVRFADKEVLFTGVLHWAIGRPDWPLAAPKAPNPADLEGALRTLATAALRRATHPSVVRLERVVAAEADRFPELAEQALAAQWPGQSLVADVLQRQAADGAIVADKPEILAELFVAMVTATPARMAAFGVPRDAATQQRHTDAAIEVFLRGLRPA